jgi:hypothetical protein
LTAIDRQLGARAAGLAGQTPHQALRWLQRQRAVGQALLGPDGATIDIHFRDGTRIAILPDMPWSVSRAIRLSDRVRARSSATAGRALVLEPFAHQVGTVAGQAAVDDLTRAGFKVDVLQNDAVTVQAMETLANYSVVYMETHAGALPGGDAVVATGETNTVPYTTLLQENSVIQILAAGDPSGTLYNAITGRFVTRHVGIFPASSVLYLDGCSVLAAPAFWQALQSRNVDVLLSWDHEVYNDVNEQSAGVMLAHLEAGETVSASLTATQAAGLGVSAVNGVTAHLGFLGDGDDTLARALAETPPTPTLTPTLTPTVTPTSTITPTVTPAATQHRKCKRGYHRVKGRCRRRTPNPIPRAQGYKLRHKHRLMSPQALLEPRLIRTGE